MGVGILQLVSYSNIDAFLTIKPQITYFKYIHERYEKFTSRISVQSFSNSLDFETRSSADISKNENLIGEITLVVDLPEISSFKTSNNEIDQISKFAWVKNIGHRIINNIELVIDNQIIDKQYGELMKLQTDLITDKNIDVILGNVKELTSFTNEKSSYRLMIPLMFWFNKNHKSYLPLISMNNNPITLRVELNSLKACCILSPSHYIYIDDDFVNFKKDEYIIQTINGVQSIGKFEYFDIFTRKLYYLKITEKGFESLTVTNLSLIQTETDRDLLLYARNSDGSFVNAKYYIYGYSTNTYVMPQINNTEIIYRHSIDFNEVKIENSFLLVEHIYLGKTETEIFKKSRIDNHIEQIIYSGEYFIDGINQIVSLAFNRPCKEIIWIAQMVQCQNSRINQWDNYTNNFLTDEKGQFNGSNIITESSILYDGSERVTFRDSKYFDTLLVNEKHKYSLSKVSPINIYSFCLEPENTTQPTGSANLSEIENISLKIKTNSKEQISIRAYAIVYNALRFDKGSAGLLFSGDVIL